MRILFATPEVSDFVQVGGLAAVSAALPRALRSFADVRVIILGYPAVLRGLKDLQPIGRCQPFAALPAFEVGLGHSADGLSYYVVRCRELYEREGTPYADGCGAEWSDNKRSFCDLLLRCRAARQRPGRQGLAGRAVLRRRLSMARRAFCSIGRRLQAFSAVFAAPSRPSG